MVARQAMGIVGMKAKIIFALLLTFVGMPATYVASPMVTAWSIREAVKSGDSDYLARKIDFAAVRETLAPSLVQYAFDMPNPDNPEPAEKPGLWKRVKAYWGGAAIQRFTTKYITADGLPKIFQMRQAYRETTGAASASAPKPPLIERMKAFYDRLIRAEFKTVSTFEIEMRDQYNALRHHVALLELRGLEWKLVSVQIKQLGFEDLVEDARFDPDDQPKTAIE
jgi:hypothetical protein